MLVTHHWSASPPVRIKDYHLEYGLCRAFEVDYLAQLDKAQHPSEIDWKKLREYFNVWKNVDFHTPTPFGTYRLNHDPRDNSADVEIGALCMGGERVSLASNWGSYPFTIGHAWFAAGLTARVAAICNIDIAGSFQPNRPDLINGPIYNVSTHAERAWQTTSPDSTDHPELGYFLYSGDPDCRGDLGVFREADMHLLGDWRSALDASRKSAAWLRQQAHEIKAAGIHDLWNLDKGITQ